MTVARQFKRVVQGGKEFLKPKKWDQWTKGDFVQGEYLGAKEKDLYGKPIHEIKVETKKITGDDPEKDGVIPLYSNGSLDYQMEFASVGDIVKITYNGMAVTSKGTFKGKACHNLTVEIDGFEPEGDDSSDIL